MRIEYLKEKYVSFMKLNGMKINNGLKLQHELRSEMKILLDENLRYHKENPDKNDNFTMIIELSKALKNFMLALKYIDLLLINEPKNRKYITEKSEILERYKNNHELPLSSVELKSLYKYLNEEMNYCTKKFTLLEYWSVDKQKNFDQLKRKFNNLGIYCDCEILFNIEDKL